MAKSSRAPRGGFRRPPELATTRPFDDFDGTRLPAAQEPNPSLMPRTEVQRFAGSIRDEQERVETLMETFLVSRTAARVRLKMLGFFGGEEPAMMLFDLAD